MKALKVLWPLFLFIAGCSDQYQADDTRTNSSNTVSTATSATPFATTAKTSHTVTYRITGLLPPHKTAPSRPWMIRVGYLRDDPKVELPYTHTESRTTGQDCSIIVSNDGWDIGELRIDIEVDGKVKQRVEGRGNPVLSADYRIPPPGATAACNDGSFSYAAHKQGSCSHHGGVAQFYLPDGSADPTNDERPLGGQAPQTSPTPINAIVSNEPPPTPEPQPTMDQRTRDAAKTFGLGESQ
jgi:hypothetical protein